MTPTVVISLLIMFLAVELRLEKLKKANIDLETKLESCIEEMAVIKEDLQKEMDRPHHARERLKGR